MLTLFDPLDIASDSALHIPDVQFCFSVSNASWNRGLKAPVIIFSLMSSTCDGSTRGGLLSYPFAALRLQLNTSCTLREHFLLIPHLDATGATCLLCLFVSGETFGSCSRPRLPYVRCLVSCKEIKIHVHRHSPRRPHRCRRHGRRRCHCHRHHHYIIIIIVDWECA